MKIKMGSVDFVTAMGRSEDFKVHKYLPTGYETDKCLVANYLSDRLTPLLGSTNTPGERLKSLPLPLTDEDVRDFVHELGRSKIINDALKEEATSALTACEIFGYFKSNVHIIRDIRNPEGWTMCGNVGHSMGFTPAHEQTAILHPSGSNNRRRGFEDIHGLALAENERGEDYNGIFSAINEKF